MLVKGVLFSKCDASIPVWYQSFLFVFYHLITLLIAAANQSGNSSRSFLLGLFMLATNSCLFCPSCGPFFWMSEWYWSCLWHCVHGTRQLVFPWTLSNWYWFFSVSIEMLYKNAVITITSVLCVIFFVPYKFFSSSTRAREYKSKYCMV